LISGITFKILTFNGVKSNHPEPSVGNIRQDPVGYLTAIINYFDELVNMADEGLEVETILDILLRLLFQICDLFDVNDDA
jgi:hypothetical protein